MIAEFPARQWKQCTLFDLVNKTDSTGSCFSGAPSHRWKLMVGWRKRFTLHGADRLAIEHARPEPCGLFDLVCLQQLVYTVKNWWRWSLETALDQLLGVDTISQELINVATDQWSKRLLLVIRLQGGHIEHRLHWFRHSLNVLTDSLMIFTDNVVGSDSNPLQQPLSKYSLILLRVLFSLLSSKFRGFWWKPHGSRRRSCKVTVRWCTRLCGFFWTTL